MGSCISKCKPKSKTNPHSHVQDKLVISQAPVLSLTPPPPPRKLPLCPSPSPTFSSSSFSSFSKNNSTELMSSLSSTSSCSSSILSSKDRSFSNDFLWSCAKENPQIISLDPIKDRGRQQKLDLRTKQNVAPAKQPIPGSLARSTTQKRPRENSPTLTRQKSFRVEVPERTSYVHCKYLKSPSPSRRFNGDNNNNNTRRENLSAYSTKESCGSNNARTRSVNSSKNKENVRPASPSSRLSRDLQSYLRHNREICNPKMCARVDEVGMKEVGSVDVLMEDIDNPLNIALDCFIFL